MTSAVFDDFNGPAGQLPDPALWGYDLGAGGWGNQELQTYTNNPANVSLDGQGHLVIRAVKDAAGKFTSAKIRTRLDRPLGYGRIEFRAKVPATNKGLWPGFWAKGVNENAVGWPTCGELDFYEGFGRDDVFRVSANGPQPSWFFFTTPYFKTAVIHTKDVGLPPLSQAFHTYWMERQPDRITAGIDGKAVGTVTPAILSGGERWVFNDPIYAIAQLGVGGTLPGNPDATSRFPAELVIDSFTYTP